MADETILPGPGLRRSMTLDDSLRSKQRPASSKILLDHDGLESNVQRRSSNLSEFSLSDARKQFQESTDDLLLPKPSASSHHGVASASHWHSAPLAFALLPALGGMLFKNGSSVVTDIMLLGLAAIFLNWSVRLPW